MPAPSPTWIRPLRPRPGARARLFLLPYAGGSALQFRPWCDAITADIEVCAVCLPGRDDRRLERPHEKMPALIQALSSAIVPWLDRPFYIFGHSMGAAIGYELALRLRATASEPLSLLVSARRPPHSPPTAALHTLPDEEFIAELVARYNAIPAAVLAEAELLEIFIPMLRADFALLETYQATPTEPLRCPIVAFGGTADSMVSEADLLEWERYTRSAFRLHLVEGDHFFIQHNQARFLTVLSAALSEAPGLARI